MEKLIITVTCDSTWTYPGYPYNPKNIPALADEVRRSVEAGASITHLHGPNQMDEGIQKDGKKLSFLEDVEGWKRLKRLVQDKCDAIIQYGIASARVEERKGLAPHRPDMMSVCFNAHDERFQPDEKIPAVEIYAIHDRVEIEAYCRLCLEYKIKPEIEVFHTGAFWNIGYMRKLGILKDPCWLTLFLGWPGGCWTPPTSKALTYLVEHLPPKCNFSVSVMDMTAQLKVLTTSIILGGHVRVGIEDNPYISDGVLARSNAELVEKIVRIAKELGRDIASPNEARKITGLGKKN